MEMRKLQLLEKMQQLFAYNSAYELLTNIDPYNF